MSPFTTNPNDPELKEKDSNTGQNKKYLVLPDEQRATEYMRPLRLSYVHKKCKVETTMAREIAETYAVNPSFYSHTWCMQCKAHLPISEFVWTGTNELVGS